MNVAQAQIEYFNHVDFKSDYEQCLFESFGSNEADIINNIIRLFNVSNYETEQLSNHKIIDREQAKKIYDFIVDNFEQFTNDFSSYRVGYTCLESISFGEQEIELSGWYNHKTGKDYTINYLKKVFDKECFYVSGNYAYYDLSDTGLYIDLLNDVELINNFLLTI